MPLPLGHASHAEFVPEPSKNVSLGQTEQSEEEVEQYEEQLPPDTSAATGLVQLPPGINMPVSLQPAVQVRVPVEDT